MSQFSSLPGNEGCDISTFPLVWSAASDVALYVRKLMMCSVAITLVNVSKCSGTSARAVGHSELKKWFPPSCVSDSDLFLSCSCEWYVPLVWRALKALHTILDVSFCHHILVSIGREVKKNVKLASCHLPVLKVSWLLTAFNSCSELWWILKECALWLILKET